VKPGMLAALTAALVAPALATTVKTLTLAEQAKKADVIVHARISDVTTQTRDGVIWTAYRLAITETVTGDPSVLPSVENDPSVWVMAGLTDAPTFSVNDELIVLLYRGTFDSPVVGFNQGVYRIQGGKITGSDTTVDDFKKNLLALRESK